MSTITPGPVHRRALYEDDHEDFRESFRRFLANEVVPHFEQWEKDGIVPREVFAAAGANGFLGMQVPEEYGGAGVGDDFRFNAIIGEECCAAGVGGFGVGITLHNDVCLPYFLEYCNEEQKQRWLPGICDGTLITAVAMTEPGTGSDLAGIRTKAIKQDDGSYVMDGAKTFITNGINGDLIITAAKTDPKERHRGLSIFIVERDTPGFERGRNLEKVGMHSQDTAELFFDGARVPAENLLGDEGSGFKYLVSNLAQERMSIALLGVGVAEAALQETITYVKERQAFGQPISGNQVVRHMLADCRAEIDCVQAFVDQCLTELGERTLTPERAASCKLLATELQGRVTDKCVQLHGGYGYMTEYAVGRMYADARVTRIYGGANEIMKEIIAKGLGVG
ncbi:Acyl-CoA dehydrogenase [Paraconexibacter sp. AEG42_29]|uniref:Acyl-[acyl-carrier-protein] dehydrogenase MbtN n=1 Tax=Paraconexibacter sp. AEG42_29 TaxID=2997339 RepID=A0AAU7B2U3_9ACTN